MSYVAFDQLTPDFQNLKIFDGLEINLFDNRSVYDIYSIGGKTYDRADAFLRPLGKLSVTFWKTWGYYSSHHDDVTEV